LWLTCQPFLPVHISSKQKMMRALSGNDNYFRQC
jgi:hypothetical protein